VTGISDTTSTSLTRSSRWTSTSRRTHSVECASFHVVLCRSVIVKSHEHTRSRAATSSPSRSLSLARFDLTLLSVIEKQADYISSPSHSRRTSFHPHRRLSLRSLRPTSSPGNPSSSSSSPSILVPSRPRLHRRRLLPPRHLRVLAPPLHLSPPLRLLPRPSLRPHPQQHQLRPQGPSRLLRWPHRSSAPRLRLVSLRLRRQPNLWAVRATRKRTLNSRPSCARLGRRSGTSSCRWKA
jgi:hypothetical protein